MIVYSDDPSKYKEVKILESDLHYMAIQLKQYVDFVRKNVRLSPDEKVSLEQLDEIAKRLLYRQYDTLIRDTSIIEYDIQNDYNHDNYHNGYQLQLVIEQQPF